MWPFRRNGSDAPLTLEKGLSTFFDRKDEWLKSTCRDQLIGLLEQHKPTGGWLITKAVVVGLIAFLEVVNHLQAEGSPKIELYSQELKHTEVEVEMLDFLGIQSIMDDKAQQMSMPGVFIFAQACPAEVEMVAQCEHRQPSLFVGISTANMVDRERDLWLPNARE
ncbi:hypothetical protein LTR36_007410 [Oleoguttula mirabilis]|uniref:Uncharacterized protein n=1 Tax=Oleoguttula mirabilis TaxID=1507867 RepID=A0AAV9J9N6_9PEZI|nr:hypothetical protein LTR36_007410 [Oleoguttula mirabilis]